MNKIQRYTISKKIQELFPIRDIIRTYLHQLRKEEENEKHSIYTSFPRSKYVKEISSIEITLNPIRLTYNDNRYPIFSSFRLSKQISINL